LLLNIIASCELCQKLQWFATYYECWMPKPSMNPLGSIKGMCGTSRPSFCSFRFLIVWCMLNLQISGVILHIGAWYTFTHRSALVLIVACSASYCSIQHLANHKFQWIFVVPSPLTFCVPSIYFQSSQHLAPIST